LLVRPGETMTKIGSAIQKVTDIMDEIASASNEQSRGNLPLRRVFCDVPWGHRNECRHDHKAARNTNCARRYGTWVFIELCIL
jgi:hypothetical protein